MKKQTKYILFGALGVGAAFGGLILLMVMVVGLVIVSGSAEESQNESNAPTAKRSSGNQSKQSSGDEAAELSGKLAPNLIGKWTRSEGSSNIDYTGKTQYKSGADYIYEFSADGRVTYSMKSDVLSIIQCKIAETKDASGKAASDGETLTISFGKMNHTSSNTCEEDENFEKTLPAEIIRLKYILKTEYEQTRLCIEESEGEACYDRQEE